MGRFLQVAVLVLAAMCEVGGDAFIRAGLRGQGTLVVVAGAVTLGAYGLVVNLLPMDFSKLLGTYVAFFAIVSVAAGKVVFREVVPASTWLGLAILLVGSLVVQFGGSR